MTRLTRADFEALDRADPLRPFRERFALPEEVIYLDGNSLGAMPKDAPARLRRVAEIEWGRDLVRSWTRHGWIDLQSRIGDKIGRLIGARPGETIVTDSTSVNLFKLLAAALKLNPRRRVILSEKTNFPTDLYIAEGLADLLGGHESERRLAHRLGTQDLLVHREDLALDLDLDGGVAAEEEVRGLLLDHELEQRLGVHHLSLRG